MHGRLEAIENRVEHDHRRPMGTNAWLIARERWTGTT
jgi:hypothetical protein